MGPIGSRANRPRGAADGPRARVGAAGALRLPGAKLSVPHLYELGERNAERGDHAQEVEEPRRFASPRSIMPA